MNRNLKHLIATGLILLTAACGDAPAPAEPADTRATDVDTRQSELIYGADNRMDFFEVQPGLLKDLGQNSVAAKISLSRIGGLDGNSDSISILPQNLRQTQKLCPEERYADQPAAAGCSGTLIANDLIMTAGHCMTAQSDCDNSAWVFNFYFEDEDMLADISPDDVFRCAEVIDSSLYLDAEVSIDHAVVRLERDATPRFTAVDVRTERTALVTDTPVTVIGFGLGLPMKFDSGGVIGGVRPTTLDFFRSNSDAFVGNSGSGVFTDDGTLVGILVAGRDDFAFDSDANCNRLATLPDSDSFEENSYGFRAIDSLCNTASRNDYALCAGRCGNELCEVGESAETCPADCNADTGKCGNAACETDETSWNCPIDCDFEIPSQWTCDEANYAAGDGCQCGCGIIDADCSNPDQDLFGCADSPRADTCSTVGECEETATMCGNNSCDRGETAEDCPIDCSNTVGSSDNNDDGCSTTGVPAPSSIIVLVGLLTLATRRRRTL